MSIASIAALFWKSKEWGRKNGIWIVLLATCAFCIWRGNFWRTALWSRIWLQFFLFFFKLRKLINLNKINRKCAINLLARLCGTLTFLQPIKPIKSLESFRCFTKKNMKHIKETDSLLFADTSVISQYFSPHCWIPYYAQTKASNNK